jgi:hypothetical protein
MADKAASTAPWRPEALPQGDESKFVIGLYGGKREMTRSPIELPNPS